MRDFLPEQAKKKQFIEDLCRRTFEKYGFEPLQSPVVEDFALLAAKGSGGEAIKDEIYYFKDKGERELGLRYDLTVPLARIVATNPTMQKPFKRYCIGTVYRYDRPQAKRYREFTQADFDIIGSKSPISDFEILEVTCDVLRSLGLEFKVLVNNRLLLEDLAVKCGVPKEKIRECFRSIDKLNKIGEKGVAKELSEKGLSDAILEQIKTNSLAVVKDSIPQSKGLAELESLLELCAQTGLREVCFDLALARGLEYYTGNVFEAALENGPSVGGGGRYDDLVKVYGGQSSPALGFSFGIDRLLDTLEETLAVGPSTDIFIAMVSEKAAVQALKLAAALRKLGAGVEVDLMSRNIKRNLEYANKKAIPFFAAIGDDELESGTLKIKEMRTGQEKEFAFSDVQEISGLVKKS